MLSIRPSPSPHKPRAIKLLAFIDAISRGAPRVAHLCRTAALRRPDLTREIWQAAPYVIRQAVTIPALLNFEDHIAIVRQDAHHVHHISKYGCLTCDQLECRHVIAYLIQVRLWQEDCQ